MANAARPPASNRYRGLCAKCDVEVPPRMGVLFRIERTWVLECNPCAALSRGEAPQETRAVGSSRAPYFYSPVSGHTVYRNARGRCEDAPCCGCCS